MNAASSGAGIEASQSEQIRCVWAKVPTGITPAMIGTSIPIARAAATKSKYTWLSKKSWVVRNEAPASTFCFR